MSLVMTTSGIVTKPNPQDQWEPTNSGLWERVKDLAQGRIKELKGKDTTYHAPRDGAGFKEFPSPKANGWCVRIYNLAGGRWRKKGEVRTFLLTGNMVEKVVERHQTKLAKMLGEDIRRSMARYQEGPSREWHQCNGCSLWVATEDRVITAAAQAGICLRYQFKTIDKGWCPAHAALELT